MIDKLVDVGNEIIDILNNRNLNYFEAISILDIIQQNIKRKLNGDKKNE